MKTETLDHRRTGAATVAAGLLLAALVALAALAISPAYAAPMTYTVDSTADTNLTACVDATADDCTLRGAINASNANTGADTIKFDIPGAGVHTITPGSSLPAITDRVTIDGYTQGDSTTTTDDDATENTQSVGNDAALKIELNGSAAPITGAFGQAGLTIFASGGGSTVRGLVINRFADPRFVGIPGIILLSGDNVIEGNFIGTDPTGTVDQGNGTIGVAVVTGARNRIGGAAPAARNVISGNGTTGAGNPGYSVFVGSSNDQLPGPTDTEILGNYIGTNAAGTAALPNSDTGIVAPEGVGTKIGNDEDDDDDEDAVVDARNVISGHPGSGILAVATERPDVTDDQYSMEIQGNYIGTDATGAAALGNSDGVTVSADFMPRADVSIGGTAPGAGNVISGNRNFGLQVFSVRKMDVQGNLVGTDASGTSDLGNGAGGLYFPINANAPSDYAITIGGDTPEARNVISGNGGDGVNVGGQTNGFVHLRRNLIGTQIDGESPLGNEGDGVELSRPATVGGANSSFGNTIAHNGGDGVLVRQFDQPGATSGMGILGNSIFSNAGLGIDLHDTFVPPCPEEEDEECPQPEPNAANDGVTPNDAGDPDAGPNDVQNFPVITSATTSGTATTISGTLNSTAGTTFRLEFFANESCNAAAPNDFGEGRTFIGSAPVTTNANSGNASFGPLTFNNVPAGQSVITSTATDPSNNTSEFSECLTATADGGGGGLPVRDDQGSTGEAAAVGNSFISQYGAESTSPTRLNRLNTAQRPYTLDQIGNDIPSHVNAIGYRSTDDSIYGYRLTSPLGIVKIDPSSGATTFLGNPRGLPSVKYIVGDVSPNGSTYYLYASGSGVLRWVDLTTMKVRSVKLSAKIKVADLAVSPLNNNLYGVAKDGKLLQVNPRTGKVTLKKVAGLVGGTYGATWFTAEGDLIAYENGATKPNGTMTWITSPTTSTPRIVSSQAGPRTNGNDGAAYVAPPRPGRALGGNRCARQRRRCVQHT